MNIPDRVREFLKHTNSFGIIMEEGKPSFIVASFDWAERVLLGVENEIEEVNKDFSFVAEQSKEETSNGDQSNV